MTSSPSALRAGGEFELDPAIWHGAAARPIAERFGRPALWTDTGRSALLIAATEILRRGGERRAWLPAYACESIAQAFTQAGFELRYYAGTPGMADDNYTPPSPKKGDSFLFIHYFGHRNETLARAAAEFRAAGIWVIEDRVQSALTPSASPADFSVTSLRKLLPVADGAALYGDAGTESLTPALAAPDEAFVSARLLGKVLRQAKLPAEEFLPLLEQAEQRLAGVIVPRRMSFFSEWILQRIDPAAIAAARRANWLSLVSKISPAARAGRIQPLFAQLRDDEVPLSLPVRVAGDRRDALRRHLAARQVYCPVHWPLPHLPAAFAQEQALAGSLLTLPIDQRMSAAHVEHVAAAIDAFFS
jgi:hypothetical protein